MRPPERHEAVDDLWVVTSYFNPVGYRSRRHNYEMFQRSMATSGVPLITIECALGDQPFTLPLAVGVLRVRAKHVLWQKERLLNEAIRQLPASCTKVAWVDCDTLFENAGWAVETSRLLAQYPVVQPYDRAVRLSRGQCVAETDTEAWRGFAVAQAADPSSLRCGDYMRHGETGLAWAARRDLLTTCGLYDACIIGGGDHVMAHALCGDWDSPCIDRLIGFQTPHLTHLRHWAEEVFRHVRGQIGAVPGAAWHLWHGEWSDRQYTRRHAELMRFGFDPQADLRIGETGCWEWATDKPAMHAWIADYFAARREDGDDERTVAPA